MRENLHICEKQFLSFEILHNYDDIFDKQVTKKKLLLIFFKFYKFTEQRNLSVTRKDDNI